MIALRCDAVQILDLGLDGKVLGLGCQVLGLGLGLVSSGLGYKSDNNPTTTK